MTVAVKFCGVEYDVEIAWEFQGQHRAGSRHEPEEFPEFFFEIESVTDHDGEAVTDKILLAGIEEELMKQAPDIQDRAIAMSEGDPDRSRDDF